MYVWNHLSTDTVHVLSFPVGLQGRLGVVRSPKSIGLDVELGAWREYLSYVN